MERRDFIKKGACGVCAAITSGFIASALLSSCKTGLGVIKTSSTDNKVTIALSEFAQSDYKLIRVANYNYDLAIQKQKDGSFETLVLECTHAGQPLTKTGNTYYCTLHGSQFSHDGRVLKGPADRDMKKLKTSIDNNNIVIILS
jgi:cytochrome b6-f complex iron-sulfur subunit